MRSRGNIATCSTSGIEMQGTVDLMVPVAGGALATSDHTEAASMPLLSQSADPLQSILKSVRGL